MKSYSGPKVLTEYILYQSRHKANKRFFILLAQGILAGIYIAIGAIANLKLGSGFDDKALGAFLGACAFPVGIIAIIFMQAELFTSDTMVMTAVYAKRTKISKILRILILIFFANLIGSIFVALLCKYGGVISGSSLELVIEKAVHKIELAPGQLFVSAILCNIIVSTGVCLSYSCKDEMSKIALLWLSITVFVITGTEHVVANMFYLSMAWIGGADISIPKILMNLGITAVGNFVGGGIIVSGANYLLAYRDIEKENHTSAEKE